MSKYDAINALAEKRMSLLDPIYGPYWMMPPELLYTSGSGLRMYMFRSLNSLFGSGMDGNNTRKMLDKLHHQISGEIRRQSGRDFPRGLVRIRIINGTKCQFTKQRGNLFLLLCLAHTKAGR